MDPRVIILFGFAQNCLSFCSELSLCRGEFVVVDLGSGGCEFEVG